MNIFVRVIIFFTQGTKTHFCRELRHKENEIKQVLVLKILFLLDLAHLAQLQ